MNCALFDRHVGHLIAGELDPTSTVAMEEHELTCATCRERLVFEEDMRGWIKSAGEGPAAPAHLRAQILAQLPVEAFPSPAAVQGTSAGFKAWHAIPFAAAALVLIGIEPAIGIFDSTPSQPNPTRAAAAAGVFRDAVRLHTSALPADVEPTAPHAVPRYFQNKVRFRVRPARFETDVRLVGARLSHLGSRRAAALYYQVQGQRLTVVVVDDQSPALHTGATPWTQGNNPVYYRTVRGHIVPIRQQHGLTYFFAGDLNRRQMLQLAATANVGD